MPLLQEDANILMRLGQFKFLLILLIAVTARADDQWILTTADFHSAAVLLRSIDASGFHAAGTGGDEHVVGMDQFLQLDRVENSSHVSPPAFFVQLADGDRIGGAPQKLQGESLIWKSSSLGELSLPMRDVRSIQKPTQTSAAPTTQRTEDILTLANGDTMHGIVSDIGPAGLAIQPTGGDLTNVPIATIASADFASTAAPTTAPASLKHAFRVSTSDGTVISADVVMLADKQLKLTLPDGGQHSVALLSITGIEQINGPVVWLSGCPIAQETQTPYFGDHSQPAQMDKTVAGDPIRFGDREFSRGIGVHSYSKLVYNIPADCRSFRTQYAIDAGASWANVTVRIKLDDRVAHEKTNVIAGQLSPVVSLDLGSAKTVTLEVDYGENYDVQDRLNWIEPAFLRAAIPQQ